MFEEISKKNSLRESLESFAYLLKAYPARSIFYIGAVPFAVLWIIRDSASTAFALQAYLVTAGVFVDHPFRREKQGLRQWWFWKATVLGGFFLHPPFLLAIWYLDEHYQSFISGTATLFLLVLVVSVVEAVILDKIVDRFRPVEQKRA